MIKIIFGALVATFSMPSLATIDGSEDIYLDSEKMISVHSIYCGESLKNLRTLKNSYIYTNTDKIEEGTYYYSSSYGDFSYTFKKLKDQNPDHILARGLLSAGEKDKSKMVNHLCIVGQIPGLPEQLSKNITKTTLSANDPEWDATMVKLTMFGKPAFGLGVYTDQRMTAKYEEQNQAVYDANQAYLSKAKKLFDVKYNQLSGYLPKQLEAGIAYAYQQDGFLDKKNYPEIIKPEVLSRIAKESYSNNITRQNQKKAWDKIIQGNFDWFFNLTTKDNNVKSITLLPSPEVIINDQKLQKKSIVSVLFDDGKILELDFLISSIELPKEVFLSLDEIAEEADSISSSPMASSIKTTTPIALLTRLPVSSSAQKSVTFFTHFRADKLAETYRVK